MLEQHFYENCQHGVIFTYKDIHFQISFQVNKDENINKSCKTVGQTSINTLMSVSELNDQNINL